MTTRFEIAETFMRALANSSHKGRRLLLQDARKEELDALYEVCLNTVRGNIPMNPEQFKQMKRHKNTIKALASRNYPKHKNIN